jgi:AraC-like DNA-binding protein
MTLRFRASDHPVASRVEYWRDVVSRAVGPLELRVSGGHDFTDRLLVGEVGPVRVAELSMSQAGAAARTPAHVRQLDPELYKVDIQAGGRGLIEQGGRMAKLEPGDFTLVDLSRPCHWVAASAAQITAVVFPKALLPLSPDEAARLTGIRIAGDRGPGALISSLGRQLPRRLDDGAGGVRMGAAVLDLLTAALATSLGRERALSPETRQRALLLRVRGFVEANLGDPELTPSALATAHHISIRYLHKLFEAEETTAADWIRRRRLERCRRDLLDPGQHETPVAAIGARWGLPNAPHFSRLFRAAYGVPPAHYRRVARSRAAHSP